MKRKHILSLVICMCMILSLLPFSALAAERHLFMDVSTTDWFSDSVHYVFEHGLMNGTSSTTFAPYRTTQRGMIVTILNRLEGSPTVKSINPFNDVPSGSNYEDAIIWAAANNIVNGYNSTTFGPYDNITRQQMAAILYRYAQMKGYRTSTSANLNEYTDSDQISSYARTAMSWANGEGLINGNNNKELMPTGNATRAQVAAIITRFCENVVPSDESSENRESSRTDVTPLTATYRVTFNLNYSDRNIYQTLTVKEGESVSAPTNPTRSGYIFDGWYTTDKNGTLFDFSTPINNDYILYAHWKTNSTSSNRSSNSSGNRSSVITYYTVTFDTNDGTAILPQNVISGNVATRPIDPIKSGYTFVGWYSDENLNSPYNFSSAVKVNITLYAKWELSPDAVYTITFESNGGTDVAPQSVSKNAKVTRPDVPFKSEYRFEGWYTDSELTTAFDFDLPVTDSITLYAKWEKAGNPSEFVPAKDSDFYISDNMYVTSPQEGTIVSDPDSGVRFINNELIIHVQKDTDRSLVASLMSEHSGIIVGEISDTDTYQIRFSREYSYSELETLKVTLENEEYIRWISINNVSTQSISFYPQTDLEWSNDWNQISTGENWGVEAIKAPAAWDFLQYMSYVNVGVYDCCFHDHEDLFYENRYFNDENNCRVGNYNSHSTHGTHVSGTIAAGFDNGKGITGVAPYVNLNGVAFTGIGYYPEVPLDPNNPVESNVMFMELALTLLIRTNDCKVLNFSVGHNYYDQNINAWRETSLGSAEGNSVAIRQVTDNAAELGEYLQVLIDRGEDFLICVAAGNANNTDYTLNGVTTKGNVDAFYSNYLSAITKSDVQDRIIVVGACKNNGDGSYSYSDFSNVGTRVDVVAPGEVIYSTVSNNDYENYYQVFNPQTRQTETYPWSGTSMATPHVSGIAAMMFSVNPKLTGDQVKFMIQESATIPVSGVSQCMVDAGAAVAKAILEDSSKTISVTGKVIDKNTGEPIRQVSVSLFNQYTGQRKTTFTNQDGEFTISRVNIISSADNIDDAFWNIYDVEFEKDDYTKQSFSHYLTLLNPLVTGNCNMGKIKLESTLSVYANVTGTVVNAESNQSLENVDVFLFDETGTTELDRTTTNGSGFFSFELSSDGTFVVLFKKGGYFDKSETVEVFPWRINSLGTIAFQPIEKRVISGVVQNSAGTGIQDVTVNVYKSGTTALLYTTTTNSDGTFSTELDDDGNYDIIFTRVGYKTYDVVDIRVAGADYSIGTVLLPSDRGDGTENHPYVITTAEEFYDIQEEPTAYYVLGNDIDLSSFNPWIPIDGFVGSLDGANYKITGLKITSASIIQQKESYHGINRISAYVGLFSQLSGTVKNINVEGANIKINTDEWFTSFMIGIIAGAGYYEQTSRIDNCTVSGLVNVINPECNVYVGGIIGVGGNVRNSNNRSAVVYEADYWRQDSCPYVYVGGIGAAGTECYSCTNSGPIAIYLELRQGSRAYQDYFTWGMRWFHADGIVTPGNVQTGGSSQTSCTNYGNVEADVSEFPYGMQHLSRWWDNWLEQ